MDQFEQTNGTIRIYPFVKKGTIKNITLSKFPTDYIEVRTDGNIHLNIRRTLTMEEAKVISHAITLAITQAIHMTLVKDELSNAQHNC